MNDEPDENTEVLFDSLKNRYQNNLELMEDSQFVFDYVHLLCQKCHKINPICGGTYIDFPNGIKKTKKATISAINKKDKKYF